MSDDLRDQLLKAGLVTKTKATQVDQQLNRKQHRQKKGQKPAQTEEQQRAAVARAQAAKVTRDRELNREHQAQAEAKARSAEIKQLIEQNQLPTAEGEEYFNFVAGKKVRRIAVNAGLRKRLSRGELVIVRHEGHSALVPAETAARIRERDASVLIPYSATPESDDVDEAYKDFVIPDDLTW